jgi:hypothetical protein
VLVVGTAAAADDSELAQRVAQGNVPVGEIGDVTTVELGRFIELGVAER